jgi:hypothetical protein
MRITDYATDASLEGANDDENNIIQRVSDDILGDNDVLADTEILPFMKRNRDDDVSIEEETLPEDLPSRADNTDEDLGALFRNTSKQHLADGFTGSGDEDGESISQNDGDDVPDLPEHPEGA